MSADLPVKIQLGLDELARVRDEFTPLTRRVAQTMPGVIEIAAACAMLHSFYTEIEKILKLVALDFDHHLPSSDSWHRGLLNQMANPTTKRPAVISSELVKPLAELLAFRHLFRGASIALMRWDKLAPLIDQANAVHDEFVTQMGRFSVFCHTLKGAGEQ